MIEMCIIAPIMIFMLWGIWRLHTSAFFQARAEMAVRHAAWIKSVQEKSSAALEGTQVFLEYGNPKDLTMTSLTCPGDAFLVTDFGDGVDQLNEASGNVFSTIGGWIKSLLDVLPITQTFVRNADANLTFKVSTPLFNPMLGKGDSEVVEDYEGKANAYFPNRQKSLYFHNIWDLFLSTNSEEFPPMGEAAGSKEQMEQMIDDYEKELEKQKDHLSDEEYQRYMEQVKLWREWLNSL